MLLAAFAAAGGVYAQKKGGVSASKKNLLFLDLAPIAVGYIASDKDMQLSYFGIGAEYQRALGKSLSLGLRGDLITGREWSVKTLYWGIALHGRYYLTSVLEEAFLDAGVGFNRATYQSSRTVKLFEGLTFELKAGYTVPLGKVFRLEPAVSFVRSKGKNSSLPVPLEWCTGLGFGLAF